jgi:diadenosine tetraphosphatase ApaH/serine/threonine PP2A family protein phosphatase
MNPEKIHNDTPPPYDIIGDIHSCREELFELFHNLGYEKTDDIFIHPQNRMPVFLGDLTDRGPDSITVLNLIIGMTERNKTLFIPGNHDIKLQKWFQGRNIQVKHGMETTVSHLMNLPYEERINLGERFNRMLDNAPPYLILDNGNLVVAHGGIGEKYIGQFNNRVKSLILFGDTTGRTDEQGLPERRDWAANYSGKALIVYGHTPVEHPRIKNNTINIDAGCVFGGKLCAFRYPEKEVVCVRAKVKYYTR